MKYNISKKWSYPYTSICKWMEKVYLFVKEIMGKQEQSHRDRTGVRHVEHF